MSIYHGCSHLLFLSACMLQLLLPLLLLPSSLPTTTAHAHLFHGSSPPMGWNTWNTYLCNVSEALIKQQAHAMIDRGFHKVGYQYVVIDDCWQNMTRNAVTGRLQADRQRFPSGIKALAAYVHQLGLKLGIYSDVGLKTCQGRPGSFDHYEIDAATFADWDVDYLKFDTCHLTAAIKNDPRPFYTRMARALNSTTAQRPILYSICNWGMHAPWKWAGEIGATMWRTTHDIYPNWARMMTIVDKSAELWKFSHTGAWNDMDMLEVGVQGHLFNFPLAPSTNLTLRESQTHMSLWCLMQSPLIMGLDLTSASPDMLSILMNRDLIDIVSHDPAAMQGRRIWSHKTGFDVAGVCIIGQCSHVEIWLKPLAGKRRWAVGLFNRGDALTQRSKHFSSETITVTWKMLGVNDDAKLLVRDLWQHRQLSSSSSSVIQQHQFTVKNIQPHEMRVFLVTSDHDEL